MSGYCCYSNVCVLQRANELSDVLKDLADKYRHFFSNFDINYVPCPLTAGVY